LKRILGGAAIFVSPVHNRSLCAQQFGDEDAFASQRPAAAIRRSGASGQRPATIAQWATVRQPGDAMRAE